MLTESCEKAICVQCKNCNILQIMTGALRFKVVETEETISHCQNQLLFERMPTASLMERPYGRVVESSVCQTQRPDCHSLPSKAYREPEIK